VNRPRNTNLVTRTLTGLALGVVVTVSIWFLPTAAAAGVLGLLWLTGSWEWAGLAGLGPRQRYAYVAIFAVLMVGVLSLALQPGLVDVIVSVAIVAWLVALVAILRFPRPIAPATVAVAGFVALLPGWILLAELHAVESIGPALTLTALALVWAADVGAYFVGRSVGRVKLAPMVSPGKTWEGVSGGVLLAAAVGCVAAVSLGLSLALLVGIAVVVALVSVVGDLTVSMLKRNVGVKDSGSLLPGHGGVMDRIDGLIAAVPFFFLALKLGRVV
jgi:phosphatidate cytidylyltransferase